MGRATSGRGARSKQRRWARDEREQGSSEQATQGGARGVRRPQQRAERGVTSGYRTDALESITIVIYTEIITTLRPLSLSFFPMYLILSRTNILAHANTTGPIKFRVNSIKFEVLS